MEASQTPDNFGPITSLDMSIFRRNPLSSFVSSRILRAFVLTGALSGLSFAPVLSVSAVAQVAGGATITGSVMDGKGGLLAKATVLVKNEGGGKTMTIITDATWSLYAAWSHRGHL